MSLNLKRAFFQTSNVMVSCRAVPVGYHPDLGLHPSNAPSGESTSYSTMYYTRLAAQKDAQ